MPIPFYGKPNHVLTMAHMAFSINGGTPSHPPFLIWDVPWNKPSIWRYPPWLWKPPDILSGWWARATPLKNMKVNWDDDIPNIWENKKCSKPPTSYTSLYSHTMWYVMWCTNDEKLVYHHPSGETEKPEKDKPFAIYQPPLYTLHATWHIIHICIYIYSYIYI